jgi:hypothetical protein
LEGVSQGSSQRRSFAFCPCCGIETLRVKTSPVERYGYRRDRWRRWRSHSKSTRKSSKSNDFRMPFLSGGASSYKPLGRENKLVHWTYIRYDDDKLGRLDLGKRSNDLPFDLSKSVLDVLEVRRRGCCC